MSTPLPTLYLRLLTLARSLPHDPLRPTLQLSSTLEALTHRAFRVDPAAAAGGAVSEVLPMDAGAGWTDKEIGVVQKVVEALEVLKSDTSLRQYPISPSTLSPPSDPLYYTRLLQGVELSAQGKARTWWKTFFGVKGEA